MARTYRESAIEEMLGTVEEAMCQVINCWGDLPPPMKEAIEQFRAQLGTAINSVEFVKRHSTGKYTKLTTAKALPDVAVASGSGYGAQPRPSFLDPEPSLGVAPNELGESATRRGDGCDRPTVGSSPETDPA